MCVCLLRREREKERKRGTIENVHKESKMRKQRRRLKLMELDRKSRENGHNALILVVSKLTKGDWHFSERCSMNNLRPEIGKIRIKKRKCISLLCPALN